MALAPALALVDTRTLRAAVAAVGDSPVGPERGTVDVDALIREPFADPADVHDRLSRLERRFADADDRRAVFLTVYVRVTEEVRADIAAGGFRDPDWVARYLTAFAELYREALWAFERRDRAAVPDAWLLAFDAALSGRTLVTQDALLGINAHVVHDLALALDRVGIDPRPERAADHEAVNAVLRRLVEVEQALLAERYAPGLADLDESFGPLDERLAFLTLREGRDWAWNCAVALADGGPGARRLVRWLLERVSLGAGRLVMEPSRDPRARERLRRLEGT